MCDAVDSAPAADDGDAGLAVGLAGLSQLVAGSGTLEQLLVAIAGFALQVVRQADGAGVTMLDTGEPDTIVASRTFVRDIDSIQYRIGEGPCISAAATGRTYGSGDLAADASWPTFGPLAAGLGIHSALSLPLVLDGEVLGAINIYAYAADAFDPDVRSLGEQFAGPAAVAVHNARVLDHAQRAVAELQHAVAVRSTIDRAVGVIMAQSGLSADDAFVRLRIKSQHDHREIVDVADELLDDTVDHTGGRRSRAEPEP